MRRVLIVLLLVLVLGPWLAPYDPVAQDRAAAHTGPGMKHLLGTDNYGRDLLSRFLAGGSWSILVGLLATAVVLALGLCIGGFAGFKGGWIDVVLMRIGDLFLSLPWLYALIGLRALMPLTMKPRAAVVTLLLVIALVSWARPARLIRGTVLSQITRGYVDAARGFGVPEWRVFRDHVMPATYSVLGAQALVLFPRFVLAEVTLSFLGLGVGAPEPSWGELILGLKEPYLLTEQWWRMLPIALMVPFFLLCAREARRFASMKSTPSVSSKCTT